MSPFVAVVSFVGMVLCYWLAAYLLARGFRSPVTRRGVVMLFALATWYLAAFVSLFEPVPNLDILSAILITITLMAWSDQVFSLLAAVDKDQYRRWHWTILAAGFARIGLQLSLGRDDLGASALWLAPTLPGWLWALLDSLLVAVLCGSIAFYFERAANNHDSGTHSRLSWGATWLAIAAVAYSCLPNLLNLTLPALPPALVFLASVVMLAYMVGARKLLVERRTTSTDFVISGLAIFGLMALYSLVAWRRGLSTVDIAFIAVLVIISHSANDLIREFLERVLRRQEGELRRELRSLVRDTVDDDAFRLHLRRGLEVLCLSLKASSGFIAVRNGEDFRVMASQNFMPTGTMLDAAAVACDDVSRPAGGPAGKMAWLAPAVSGEWLGVVGLGQRHTLIEYATTDLDWLADFADWVGQMASTNARQQASQDQIARAASDIQRRREEIQKGADDIVQTLTSEPDSGIAGLVEDGLRNIADYGLLGDSALAASLNVAGGTTIERGKAVRALLLRAIESLRPAATMPKEPLPREWYAYAILYGAYIEDAPNREVMARLYVSEGTFHRHRRRALKAVSRSLMEMTSGPASAPRAALMPEQA